ncbi:hypothetical protein [Streptomyces sp. NPDC005407]|uniref:hypothetical protein n=1 Tax=Streptomyces sp. NPDC005407 TaxID=3155340 RepID=UPI0033B1C135
MTAPPRLARVLRFALSELGSQNAHHEFEHLCRHIAKKRIASNVLPATGPVASGGDQGRDFETFHTYLREQLPFSTGFLARAVDDTVVFACTLQEDGLASKIRSDVDAICSQGTPVDRVVVFAAHNVPVAKRHQLKDQARGDHAVALEILDGEAIAELLADQELFWIAEEYLHLPSELQPLPPPDEPALPEWYTDLRGDWQAREAAPASRGDLLEVARGLRHATFHREARDDLQGWLTLAERLLVHPPGQEARQRARYEIAVATLRGTSTLRPAEPHVRAFFAETCNTDSPTLLYDASILLQYCEGAYGRGATDLTLEETARWNADVRQRLEALLSEQPSTHARAALLQAVAHLALHFDYTDAVPPDPGTLDDAEAITQGVLSAVEDDDLPSVPTDARFLDIEAGMARLTELVELLPQASMFPVDTLAALFGMLSPALIDHPLYSTVRDGLDAATARQAGGNAVADRCRQRAMGLLRANRLLDALREFHDAKVNWWHGDTLRGSLLAMALIANIYSRLGMPLAAKKYALAVAAGALRAPDEELRDLIAPALFLAATYDHQAGAWITSAETTAVAALAQINYASDPWNSERYPHIATAVTHQGFTMLAARHLRPKLVQPLRKILETAGFGDFIDFAMTQMADVPAWDETKWLNVGPDMTAPPFSDAGPERLIKFTALGLQWTVRCRNERPVVLAAEAFAAAVQVLLVELAVRDPLFLTGTIEVDVRGREPGRPNTPPFEPRRDGSNSSRWLVYAPVGTGRDDDDGENVSLLATLVEILITHSLLPAEKFMSLLENAFKAGITHKLVVGRPYRELADLYGVDYHSPAHGLPVEPLGDAGPFPGWCAAELEPSTNPGPGYTREKAVEAVRARYERLPPVLHHTLPRLLADSRTHAVFAELRSEGWKDWHLLNALTNLVINARVAAKHGTPTWETADSFKGRFIAEMNRPEEHNDPSIAVGAVTRNAMEDALKISAMTTLRSWDLELHQDTVDPEAILQFLGSRYGYWDDDTDHYDFFPSM